MQSYGSKIFIIFISVVQKRVVTRCWYKFHFQLYFVFVRAKNIMQIIYKLCSNSEIRKPESGIFHSGNFVLEDFFTWSIICLFISDMILSFIVCVGMFSNKYGF